MHVLQFSSADVEETAELRQLQLVEFWTGCCMPVVCNDRCRVVDDVAQFIDGCGRPCDHAATFYFDSGSATDSVHRRLWTVGGRSSSQQRWALGFHHGGYGGDEGFFGPFSAIFRATRLCPGVERPVFGALDGEEFFAIEGSCQSVRSDMLT